MQLKFAMLEILANRSDGRASIDELSREWEEAAESEDTARRFSEFDGIDLLQEGLVLSEEGMLCITDAGRSVVRALEILGEQPAESGQLNSQSLKAIDDLIGTELRTKIFDLELRAPGEILDLAPLEKEQPNEPDVTQTETEADVYYDEAEPIRLQTADESAEVEDLGRPVESSFSDFNLPNAPDFLKRNFRSRFPTPVGSAHRGLKLPAALTSHFGRFFHILRGHLAEGSSSIKTHGRPAGISGALLGVLSLVVILVGAGLFIAVNQIKTLKSEITALERQIVPLKKQVTKTDRQEKKNNTEQKDPLQNQILSVERGTSPFDNRPTPAALVLSPDEMRLIREYIKPAPFSGPAASPINVGDPVTIATIPLPSPLMDKVPKLLGGRFTIRNGAIIILKRDSHQADAVLTPN